MDVEPATRDEQDLLTEIVCGAPSASLSSYVLSYRGFSESGPPVRRRALPVASVEVVFAFEGRSMLALDQDEDLGNHASFVRGLSTSRAVSEHDERFTGLMLSLTPLGSAAMFGVPGVELRNQIVPLDSLLGSQADCLVDALRELPNWARRFALLEKWIQMRVATETSTPPDVERAWRKLSATRGRTPIAELVGDLGCSRRHLSQRFGETIGMTPKTYGRVLRFEHVVEQLRKGTMDLPGVAFQCGYYDQAHFNREVREFAGASPTALLAERMADGTSFGSVVRGRRDDAYLTLPRS